jgi:enamidase
VKVAIVNLGQIVSGDWRAPFAAGDTIISEGDRITLVGTAAAAAVESADVVIDAGGMTAIPGLIDSHVHITFGDYTPRQRTVGYLESYLHGGITTAISASEVHVPGRPSDPEGIKALALAAQRCFATYRPAGMRVIAGSVILEPELQACDFTELAEQGVTLAKAGFGAVKTAYDYVPLVRDAKAAGLITTCHTGGSSIPGSGAITGDHLLAMRPHVSFHINGGPTAMPDSDFERVIKESDIALQVCTAGNLRTTLLCARLAEEHGAFDRFIMGTDTPTGSGVMPLGLLYTIAHCASLTHMAPERFVCATTGSNARVYRLDSGFLATGKAADIVLLDAPDGGTQRTALAAIKNGDIAAIGGVVTAGVPRFIGRSRNTPGTTRKARVVRSAVIAGFFSGGALAPRRQSRPTLGAVMELEPEQLFLDDFSAGQTYPGQPRTMTKDDILSFAALTGDAHPIHYDDEYAKSTRFGRPIVHGLHLMALTALGATPLSAQLTDSMIAMLEQQATFRKPVFKDDTLRPQIEIEAIDRQPGKDWGKLAMKVRLINQREEIVLEGRHVYRVRCRTDQKK